MFRPVRRRAFEDGGTEEGVEGVEGACKLGMSSIEFDLPCGVEVREGANVWLEYWWEDARRLKERIVRVNSKPSIEGFHESSR
jgi:hypothetical protein